MTFPDDYPSEEHRGKEAAFDVEVLDIEGPVETKVDDQMAKDMGLDDLDVLRNAIRERTEAEYGQASRMKVKRELLDKLADRFSFDVPSGMVDAEFDTIWPQVEEALKHAREHADDPDHEHDPDLDRPEDELKAEYRQIAERRVRLGLLLSEIGQRNNIQVTQEELNRGLIAEARRYPGQEQQVIDFFQKNPQAIDSIRAPLFEDKVVDYIVDLAKVTDEPVTPEELLADPDEEPPRRLPPRRLPPRRLPKRQPPRARRPPRSPPRKRRQRPRLRQPRLLRPRLPPKRPRPRMATKSRQRPRQAKPPPRSLPQRKHRRRNQRPRPPPRSLRQPNPRTNRPTAGRERFLPLAKRPRGPSC